MGKSRAINLSAGPASLPTEILQNAQSELLDWHNIGASVMEISHRSPEFMDISQQCLQRLRQLLNISQNYEILMLQGGARLQFAMLPLNILQPGQVANCLVSGLWSELAAIEAARLGKANAINIVADTNGIKSIRPESDWKNEVTGDYLHYAPNETIAGIVTPKPNCSSKIIADMSSCILSEPINVSDYSVIYACAQKNMGTAGLTFVIIDKNLELNDDSHIPSYLSYKQHIAKSSMLNTPPTFSIYIANLLFGWLEQQGGLPAIQKQNQQKAQMLYDYIDQSEFYHNNIDPSCRSLMNVPFTLRDAEQNDVKFIEQAKSANIIGIKGHRSTGGMRASIYNSISVEDIATVINFMDNFATKIK